MTFPPGMTGGVAHAGPGEPGRPWSSGPPPVAGSIAAAVTGDPPAVAIRDSGRGAIPDAAGWQPAGLSRAAELLMTVEGRIGPEGAQP